MFIDGKHVHRLYGFGPEVKGYGRVIQLNVVKEVETNCVECVHNKVCSHKMVDRCGNYHCGTSEHYGTCHSCLHHYPRWDDKDPIPCFQCNDFMPSFALSKTFVSSTTHETELGVKITTYELTPEAKARLTVDSESVEAAIKDRQ